MEANPVLHKKFYNLKTLSETSDSINKSQVYFRNSFERTYHHRISCSWNFTTYFIKYYNFFLKQYKSRLMKYLPTANFACNRVFNSFVDNIFINKAVSFKIIVFGYRHGCYPLIFLLKELISAFFFILHFTYWLLRKLDFFNF